MPYKNRKNGVYYEPSKEKPKQPDFLGPTYIAMKLYAISWSVAHIARYLGVSAEDVRRMIGLLK